MMTAQKSLGVDKHSNLISRHPKRNYRMKFSKVREVLDSMRSNNKAKLSKGATQIPLQRGRRSQIQLNRSREGKERTLDMRRALKNSKLKMASEI